MSECQTLPPERSLFANTSSSDSSSSSVPAWIEFLTPVLASVHPCAVVGNWGVNQWIRVSVLSLINELVNQFIKNQKVQRFNNTVCMSFSFLVIFIPISWYAKINQVMKVSIPQMWSFLLIWEVSPIEILFGARTVIYSAKCCYLGRLRWILKCSWLEHC